MKRTMYQKISWNWPFKVDLEGGLRVGWGWAEGWSLQDQL